MTYKTRSGGNRRYPSSASRRQSGRINYTKHKKRSARASSIDPQRFINKAIPLTEEPAYVPTHQFKDFNLSAGLAANLVADKLSTPTPIQDQSIPVALENRDVLGLANTGTGKTAAFLVPIIEKLINNPAPCGVLILAPTRELAQQIDAKFRLYATGQKRYSALVVGGVNMGKQIREIKRGPQVIIGTPGRVKDLINRSILRFNQAHTFVLDEADRMCDMGFVHDIKSIAHEIPADHQTLCFSATMTPNVRSIVKEFMREPETISVVKGQTNEHIEQSVVHYLGRDQKSDKLVELLSQPELNKVIVFGETKHGVQRLSDRLEKRGIKSVAIHGNKSQSQRQRALDSFHKGHANVMVATDVAARGIDVRDVSHVINYDLPRVYSDYVHRIGRTGRAGKLGHALTFVPQA